MSSSSPVLNVKALLMEQGVTLWRHKWTALAACWFVCLVGWAAVMAMPRQYESNARAFVNVNGLLAPLLKGLVIDTNITETSDYLRQTLLSRPNLEQVLHLAQLDVGKTQVQKDALIAGLATAVTVRPQAKDLFTISYSNTDPVVAKNVVESLLTIFAEKAASSSRVEMEKARKFLDDQIANHEQQLRAAEQRRADFLKNYRDYLADPTSGVPRVQALQQQMLEARLAYNQAVVTRDSLQAQLKEIPQFLTIDSPIMAANGRLLSGNAPATRLAQAKANLDALRQKYTDKHPDVVAAKNEVADLQKLVDASAETSTPGDGRDRIGNPTYDAIRLKLVDVQTVIQAARQRLDQASTEFNQAKLLTADLPDIDAKAKDLDRDYDVVKKNHDELVSRREAATLSQAADDQADRTQFRIVDPPLVPVIPSSPNLPIMFSLVFLIGIGAGVGVPILIEQIRATFSSALSLRSMGLPVLGTVTLVSRASARRGIVAGALAAGVAATVLVAAYGTLMVLSRSGYGAFL